MTHHSDPTDPETPPPVAAPRKRSLLRAVRVPRPGADATVALRQTHIGLVTAEQNLQDLLYGISAAGVRGCQRSPSLPPHAPDAADGKHRRAP